MGKSWAEYRWLMEAGCTISDGGGGDGSRSVVTNRSMKFSHAEDGYNGFTLSNWPLRGIQIHPTVPTAITFGVRLIGHMGYRDVVHRARVLSALNGIQFNQFGGAAHTAMGMTVADGYIATLHGRLDVGEGWTGDPGHEPGMPDKYDIRLEMGANDSRDYVGGVIAAPFWHDWDTQSMMLTDKDAGGDVTHLTGTTMDGQANTYSWYFVAPFEPGGKGAGNWLEENSFGLIRSSLPGGVSASKMPPFGCTYTEDFVNKWAAEGWKRAWRGRTCMMLGVDHSFLGHSQAKNFNFWKAKRGNDYGYNYKRLIGMPERYPPDAAIYHVDAFNDGQHRIEVQGTPWKGMTLQHSYVYFFGDIKEDRVSYYVQNNGSNWLDVGINPNSYGIPGGCSFILVGTPEPEQIRELMIKADEYRDTWSNNPGDFTWSQHMTDIKTAVDNGDSMNTVTPYPVITPEMLNEIQLAWQPVGIGITAPVYDPNSNNRQAAGVPRPDNYWTLERSDGAGGVGYTLKKNAYIRASEETTAGTSWDDEDLGTVPAFPWVISHDTPAASHKICLYHYNGTPPPPDYLCLNEVALDPGSPGQQEFYVTAASPSRIYVSNLYRNIDFDIDYYNLGGSPVSDTNRTAQYPSGGHCYATTTQSFDTTKTITVTPSAGGSSFTKVGSLTEGHPNATEYSIVQGGLSFSYSQQGQRKELWEETPSSYYDPTTARLILSFPSFESMGLTNMSSVAIRVSDTLSYIDPPLNEDYGITMRGVSAGYFLSSTDVEDMDMETLWDQSLTGMGWNSTPPRYHWQDMSFDTGAIAPAADEKIHVVIQFGDESSISDESGQYDGDSIWRLGYALDETLGDATPATVDTTLERTVWAYAFAFADSITSAPKDGAIIDIGVFTTDPRYYLLE